MTYLERLLDGAKVEWKPLGEVSHILRSSRLTRNQLSNSGEYPVFHGGLEPLGHYKQSNRPAYNNDYKCGASVGIVGYSVVDFWSSDGCFCINQTDLFNSKFLYYVLIGYQNFRG